MNDNSPYPQAGQNWRLYAQLELAPVAVTVAGLEAWLKAALHRLELSGSFMDKLLASVQDIASGVSGGASRVRLLVFILAVQPSDGQTWGFFQTVKQKGAGGVSDGSALEIALYLYGEGVSRGNGSENC